MTNTAYPGRTFHHRLLAALAASVLAGGQLAHADNQPPVAAPAPALTAAVVPAESPELSIADAVKGLKGKGVLQAKIDVETDGIKGSILCTLFEDKTPHTVANFVSLARGLRKWKDPKTGQWVKRPLYDNLVFHRVIPDFMIQGGDPEGSGRGSPGYEFDDEIKSDLVFDKHGVLAMANKGINRQTGHGTNGSQFFVTDKETMFLNGRHTIFGQCEPNDLVARLARVPAAKANRPDKDVVMKKVTIQRAKK